MHGYDPRHASGFGNIITRPGVALRLSEDIVALSARGDSTVVLLTTANEDFEKTVNSRRAAIRGQLTKHLGWSESPVNFMLQISQLATKSSAMAESSITRISFDAGTALFEDSMFVREPSSAATPPPVAWRRVCSPELDQFSKGYAVRTLSSLVSSFKVITPTSPVAVDQRRKIVADAISFLIATAAQVMQLTNGELMYVPDGHCINIVMPLDRADVVHVVVNDPTGSGWKIIDPDTAAVAASLESNKIMARVESLVEFCSRCVANAIVRNGLDNSTMKKIVDGLSLAGAKHRTSVVTTTGKKRSKSCAAGFPKMAILTSGNSTVTGEGLLYEISEDGQQHTPLSLSEFRVDVNTSDSGSAAINVEPRIVNEGGYTSPSILQWFHLPEMQSSYVEENRTDNKVEEIEKIDTHPTDQEWAGVPISVVTSPKQWRACQISDMVFSDAKERSWRSRLVRAHKFEWNCSADKRSESKTILDNIAAAVAIATHSTFNDRSRRAVSVTNPAAATNNSQCGFGNVDALDENLINATKLLCDVYGFRANNDRPVVVLDKTERVHEGEYDDGSDVTGDGDQYVLTIVGNAPSAESVRAIRVVKQKSYSSHFRVRVADCHRPSSACKWFEVSPAKAIMIGYPGDDVNIGAMSMSACEANKRCGESKNETLFTFTPRCFYHTQDESYIHLYSDGDGPYDNVTFDEKSRRLQIGGTGLHSQYTPDAVAERVLVTIERPLVVAAVASATPIIVNGELSANPSKISDKRTKDADDRGACSFPSNDKVIDIQISLPSLGQQPPLVAAVTENVAHNSSETSCLDTLEMQCTPSQYFKCPTEEAILKYGETAMKREADASTTDDFATAQSRCFFSLVC